ncbi:virion structural protein [Vibrio phage vB_pir03]|nr:virion structural protein [Vibrio phage vB_pir03]
MALFGEEESVPETPVIKETVVEHNTATVYEDRYPGKESGVFITEIEGSPWTTEAWIGQILGEDDYPNRHDLALDPSLQQYARIHNLELRTTTSLSGETDDNVITTISGEATVLPGIVPNQWDMFIATMKDGRKGIFAVVELPRPLTYFAYTAYSIQYELMAYWNQELQDDIDSKVVKELYFNPDNPYCPTENVQAVVERVDLIKYILKYLNIYYSLFYDRRNETFLYVDDSRAKIYDDAVSKFMNHIVPHQARDKARHPFAQLFSVPSNDYQFKSKTIYDILQDNELNLLPIVDTQYQKSSTAEFYSPFVMHSILMTDIRSVYHPSEMSSLLGKSEPEGTYVFSKDFYDCKPTLEFERLVFSALNREKQIVSELVQKIDTNYEIATMQEKFHNIPIYLWLLIREL